MLGAVVIAVPDVAQFALVIFSGSVIKFVALDPVTNPIFPPTMVSALAWKMIV